MDRGEAMSTEMMALRTLRAEPPWLARVRLHARRRVLWLRFLWSTSFNEAQQGLAITHSEVDRNLTDPGELAEAERNFYATDPEVRPLNEAIITVNEQVAGDEHWARLRSAFAIPDHELDLLALAAAAEVDPALRRVYGYLHDDAIAAYATPWLAALLFDWPPDVQVGLDDVLASWHIARPLEGAGDLGIRNTPWTVDSAIVSYLLGDDWAPILPDSIEGIMVAPEGKTHCLYPKQLAAMTDFVRAMQVAGASQETALEIEIIGPPKAGKRTLAAQLGAALGRSVMAVDVSRLASKAIEEAVIRVVRAARLSGAVLLWRNADRLEPGERCALHGSEALMFFTGQTPLEERHDDAVRRSFRLPPLRRATRISLW